MNKELLNDFLNFKVKAKKCFEIIEISKKEAKKLIVDYHYLGEKDFLCSYAYGLKFKDDNELLGVAVFGSVGGSVTLKGWFGFDNTTTNILELTRLVMNPVLNNTNATSFLLSNSIKRLKKEGIKAIISLADSSRHIGYIYQACNFNYYGLTSKKTDFYCADGRLNPKGSTKNLQGVWLPRTRKHRYCYLIDKNLKVLYKQEKYPKSKDFLKVSCCYGSDIVYDKRFKKYYTCPKCTGKLIEIPVDNNIKVCHNINK